MRTAYQTVKMNDVPETPCTCDRHAKDFPVRMAVVPHNISSPVSATPRSRYVPCERENVMSSHKHSDSVVTMSASSKVSIAVENGAIAHVNFRVRCETLGHGEEVFLVQEGDSKRQKVR